MKIRIPRRTPSALERLAEAVLEGRVLVDVIREYSNIDEKNEVVFLSVMVRPRDEDGK